MVDTVEKDQFGYHTFTCPGCGLLKYGDKEGHIALCTKLPSPVSTDAIAFARAQKAAIDAAVADAIAKMEAQFKAHTNPSGDAQVEAAIQRLVEDGLSRQLAAAIVAEKGPAYLLGDKPETT